MIRHDERSACPSVEVLHRFVEGRLDQRAAIDLTKHLEDCRDCRFVVRETMALLESGDAENSDSQLAVSRRHWPLAMAAAAILVLALQFFLSSGEGRRFDHALTRTPIRPTEGRLSGIPYRRYAERRGDATAVASRLLVLADAVLASEPRRASEWHRRGIARLVKGDTPVAAVVSLAKAAELAPEVAPYWSDLAAARIAAGMAANDAKMLEMATSDASRARQLDPRLAEALFNLAVSLERRGLLTQARVAYSEYLTVDDHSSWAAEVRIRLASSR